MILLINYINDAGVTTCDRFDTVSCMYQSLENGLLVCHSNGATKRYDVEKVVNMAILGGTKNG